MSSDYLPQEEKKPLLDYSEHLERAELVDQEEFDSMPPRKRRRTTKKRKGGGGGGRKKGGVRFIKGRVSIKGHKYAPSQLIRQINNAVLTKAAGKLNSGKVRKSRKGKRKGHRKRKR